MPIDITYSKIPKDKKMIIFIDFQAPHMYRSPEETVVVYMNMSTALKWFIHVGGVCFSCRFSAKIGTKYCGPDEFMAKSNSSRLWRLFSYLLHH